LVSSEIVFPFNSSILVVGGCVVSVMDGGWVKGWMDCFEFTYMIEWVLEGVSFSPNEILTMETILQDFPDI
jgi:hypothetical protein